MFCPKCGKNIGNDKFCKNCGVENKKTDKEATNQPEVKKSKKKYILYAFIFIIVINAMIDGANNGVEKIEEKQTTQVESIKENKKTYDEKVLDIIPIQKGKGYDRTIKKYGIKIINRINELLPKAASIMAKSDKCDKLVYVALSDNRSTKENIVIFGDCKNQARFYLSENEIDENTREAVLSKKEKMEQYSSSFFEYCEREIKSQLNYPSTYDSSAFSKGIDIDEYKATILIDFIAKNAFNLKLKYRAICIFDDKPSMVSFNMNERKE